MPRRAAAQLRPIEPDSVHRSRIVQQVINKVMLDGKKSTAEKIVYDALSIIGERTGKDPVEQLEASIKALTPVLEDKSRRVGGATYQDPLEAPPPPHPPPPAPPRGRRPPPVSPPGPPRPPRARPPAVGCWSPPASAARRRWR